MTDAPAYLCLVCSKTCPAGDYKACPNCGDRGIPADLAKTVDVAITWHELRCIVMWAEMWAAKHQEQHPTMQKVVYGIADRLQAQHMDENEPLTFTGELTQLREAFGEVYTTFNEPPMDDDDA